MTLETSIAELIAERRENARASERAHTEYLARRTECHVRVCEALEILADQLDLPYPELRTDSNGNACSIMFQGKYINVDHEDYTTLIHLPDNARGHLVNSIEPLDVVQAILNAHIPNRTLLAVPAHD